MFTSVLERLDEGSHNHAAKVSEDLKYSAREAVELIDTGLRRLKRAHVQALSAALSVIGVDDWAWRKGQRYGTILVDLERHAPLDWLADRSAESLESWLNAYSGVKVISRDRAGAYAAVSREVAHRRRAERKRFTEM